MQLKVKNKHTQTKTIKLK